MKVFVYICLSLFWANSGHADLYSPVKTYNGLKIEIINTGHIQRSEKYFVETLGKNGLDLNLIQGAPLQSSEAGQVLKSLVPENIPFMLVIAQNIEEATKYELESLRRTAAAADSVWTPAIDFFENWNLFALAYGWSGKVNHRKWAKNAIATLNQIEKTKTIRVRDYLAFRTPVLMFKNGELYYYNSPDQRWINFSKHWIRPDETVVQAHLFY